MVMSIEEALDKLQNAIYGRDVRQALYDAIYTMNNEVANTGADSVGTTNLKDKSVTPFKTGYLELNSNGVIDPRNIRTGGYYSPTYGDFRAGSYFASDVIPTQAGEKFKGNYATWVVWDENYNVLSTAGLVTNGVVTMPTNAKHIAFNFDNAITYPTARKVTSNTAPESYYEPATYKDTQFRLTKDNISPDFSVSEINAEFFLKERTVNMFDKYKAVLGRYNNTGSYANNGTATSDFIPVNEGDVVRSTTTGYYTYYDINKSFVSGTSPTNMATVPSGTGIKYVRTTTYANSLDAEMVTVNNPLPLTYMGYYKYTLKPEYVGSSFDNLNGKKLVVLGDSLSELAWGGIKKWSQILSEKYGMVLADYSDGGTRVASTDRTTTEPDFVDRVDTLPTDGDIYIIYGGRNDKANNVPIGTITSTDKTTFCGAINVIITTILNKNPHAIIGFMTPIQARYDTDTDLAAYSDAMINTCKRRGIPVCDLSRESGIDPKNDISWSALFVSGDEVHLKDAGQVKLSKRVDGFLHQIA